MLTLFPRSDGHPRAKWSSSKISIRGAQSGFRGGELEGMHAQALEERTYRLDVSRRVRVEDDQVVEAGHHLFQALHNLVDNLDEPPG